jgi:hypothetical protein
MPFSTSITSKDSKPFIKNISRFIQTAIIGTFIMMRKIVLCNKNLKLMKKITLILSIFISTFAYAQDPSIQWQKTYGGKNYDVMYSAESTSDGGYIFGCYSSSGISRDKTQTSNGGNDIWIIKTDAMGVMQWKKRFWRKHH